MTTSSGTDGDQPFVRLDELGDPGQYGSVLRGGDLGVVGGYDDHPLRRPGLGGEGVQDLRQPADLGRRDGRQTKVRRFLGGGRSPESVGADEEHRRDPRTRRRALRGRG